MDQLNIEQSRGILNPELGAKKFQLSRHQPSPALSFFIERYWIVRWDLKGQGSYVQETLPYPCVNAVFEKNASNIFGVDTGKFARFLEGEGRVFGIKFKPGAFYPLLKRPVSQLTDKTISFQSVFAISSAELASLEEELFAQKDEEVMKRLVETFLLPRLPEEDEQVREINRIIAYISSHREITKVDMLVQDLTPSFSFSFSKRSLQRLFHLYVGVSPKWVIQRFRLHEVAEQLGQRRDLDWKQIALDLGYFDQAHFIKDFKAVIGKTPAEYRKQMATE